MVRLVLIFFLCTLPSVCWGDVISDLRPAIWKSAATNQVDPVFMEAILRHESANGTSKGARTKNNLAGIMRKRGGLRSFESKEECVSYLGELLHQYGQRGLTTVNSIGRRYAGRRKQGEWSYYINLYMKQIKTGKWGALDEKRLGS